MARSAHAVGPRSWIGGFFSAVLIGCLAPLAISSPAAAQARPDTARAPRDTTGARQDTTGAPAPAPRDTTPPPVLPELPEGASPSFGADVWVFDRDALLRSAAVTLGELLERIPGITPVQAGFYVQPSEVSTLAGAGGRVELYLDGYALDPLSSAAVDLARVELVQLARVRVERRFDVLRIDLFTASPTDRRAYARIEAGVTEPRGNLFRGLFLAPRFLIGPFAGGVERLDTQGFQRDVSGNETGGWAKWGWIRPRFGVQGEIRRNTVERSENVPWIGDFHRTDWTLRARARFVPGLTGEAYYGGSSVDQPSLDSIIPAPQPPVVAGLEPAAGLFAAEGDSTTLKLSGRQAGVRLGYEHGGIWGLGAFRVRTEDLLPRSDLDFSAGGRLGTIVEVDGGVRFSDWDSRQVTSARVRGRLSPVRGLSLFGEVGGGVEGTQFLRDSASGAPLFTDRSGVRGGVELNFGRLAAGGAVVHVSTDSVAPFGLPFDRVDRLYPGTTLTGLEGFARLHVWGPFAVEGSGNRWNTTVLPIYTPQMNWRAALVYEASPLPTGNLNIYARAEARTRSAMLVPAPTTADLRAVVAVPAVTGYDLYLSVRILDFRLFLRFEDMLHDKPVVDIPERFIPGPRLFYGVKWQFFD